MWEKLEPKKKRLAVVALVVAGVLGGLFLFVQSGGDDLVGSRFDTNVSHIFTEADTREITLEGLSKQLSEIQDQQAEMQTDIESWEEDQNRRFEELMTRRLGMTPTEVRAFFSKLQDKLGSTQIERRPEDMPVEPVQGRPSAFDVDRPSGAVRPLDGPVADAEMPEVDLHWAGLSPPSGVSDLDRLFEEDFERRGTTAGVPIVSGSERERPGASGSVARPNQVGNGLVRVSAPEVAEEKPKTIRERMPAGSLLTGRIITGLDAPTGSRARQNPHPVLIRMTELAILPNRFRAEIRECFILASGHGDLSSERAYLRTERLSCVKTDGEIVDLALEGYVAGEDGKAGVRGRVVSKQGQFIGRALVVGFLEGVANALADGNTSTIGLNSRNEVVSDSDDDSIASSVIQGTGSALNKIADFYVDQAGDLFPVIEIDAARKIDVVLTAGVEMKILE